jgi:predicted DCC family thiol-disulfide oxidoreductase YuxK
MNEKPPTIIYDGDCPFCRGAVAWIAAHASPGRFDYLAAQSETGRALQERYAVDALGEGTLLLIEDGRVHRRSAAALKIAARLDGAWSALRLLRIVPRPLRDWVYDLIARQRDFFANR